MLFITNGYERFSNTNSTDPRQRVPLFYCFLSRVHYELNNIIMMSSFTDIHWSRWSAIFYTKHYRIHNWIYFLPDNIAQICLKTASTVIYFVSTFFPNWKTYYKKSLALIHPTLSISLRVTRILKRGLLLLISFQWLLF